jgi:hypothetical protein
MSTTSDGTTIDVSGIDRRTPNPALLAMRLRIGQRG